MPRFLHSDFCFIARAEDGGGCPHKQSQDGRSRAAEVPPRGPCMGAGILAARP